MTRNTSQASLADRFRLGVSVFAVAAWAMAAPAFAQTPAGETADGDAAEMPADGEVIVVTATTVPRPAKEIGSAITILDAQALEDRQTILVSDLLRDVPGLAVNRTGAQGTLTQVRIRGAEGNQTQVIIDGIEANDPFFSEFNFANLLETDIERIEVLRGPQSAIYGSESLGGVISVLTRVPEPGLEGSVEVEVGSFDTQRYAASLGGGTERIRARGAFTYYRTNGINTSPFGKEEDGYRNYTGHFKVVANPTSYLSLQSVVRVVDNVAELDGQDFTFGSPTQGLVINTDQVTDNRQIYAANQATLTLFDGRWVTKTTAQYTDTKNDNLTEDVVQNGSTGQRWKYGVQTTGFVTTGAFDHALTLAGQYERLEFESIQPFFTAANQEQSDEQKSVIAEYNGTWFDSLYVSGSVRRDFNDLFDDATTYRATLAYVFDATGTRLHGSYGTGITDPTFFERFGFNPGTFVGNPDLQPETSQGFDIGVEQPFLDGRFVVDVTYFNANLEDEITTVFAPDFSSSSPINQEGESERQGVEISLRADLTSTLSLTADYTYLDATDPDGRIEVRRPEHTASGNLTWRFLEDRGTFNANVRYNGTQEDSEFIFATPEDRVELDSYVLVNLSASYAIDPGFEIFARAENVLDEDYQEVFGFEAQGFGIYGGLRGRF